MSDLALDPATGDLELTAGRARLVTGAEAVAQSWASHLTLFRGECFLDRNLGLDYQNEVLTKGQRPAVLRAIFAQATRETPGITDITDLRVQLAPATRTLSVVADVLASDEEATLSLSEQIGGV